VREPQLVRAVIGLTGQYAAVDDDLTGRENLLLVGRLSRLVFTSSAFAPVNQLPGWMQPVARYSPITAAIDTARGLALGNRTLRLVSHIDLSTAAWHFALWWLAIVGLFTALAVRRYRLG